MPRIGGWLRGEGQGSGLGRVSEAALSPRRNTTARRSRAAERGAATGYVSHLPLDAVTPRGIPRSADNFRLKEDNSDDEIDP